MKVEEPIIEYGMLNPDGSYTYWDYLKWRFTERVELIRGKLFKMSPAPNVAHQQISINILGILFPIFNNQPCRFFTAPFDVRLPVPSALKDSTVVQPDITIICDAEKLRDGLGCEGAPDLVMEILSPGNSRHEMETKYRLYEESGVKEYWIIHPSSRTVLIYKLENGKYIGLPPATEGMTIQSTLFPNLYLSLDQVFQNLPKTDV